MSKKVPKAGTEGSDEYKVDVPVKGVTAWRSTGKTSYTKAVVYISDSGDASGKHFYVYPIAELCVAGHFFVHELGEERRLENVLVGMWSPDAPVRIFAKIARCE